MRRVMVASLSAEYVPSINRLILSIHINAPDYCLKFMTNGTTIWTDREGYMIL